tara:strand:- start:140 stop:247 length:108 start_codon:yes stop_codon:yes gene_type:complete
MAKSPGIEGQVTGTSLLNRLFIDIELELMSKAPEV